MAIFNSYVAMLNYQRVTEKPVPINGSIAAKWASSKAFFRSPQAQSFKMFFSYETWQ